MQIKNNDILSFLFFLNQIIKNFICFAENISATPLLISNEKFTLE